MAQNFSAQVSKLILKYKDLTDIVARESIQRTIDLAQLPKAKGGNMPVDTGFLRASGQQSFTGMPTGPVRGVKREDPDDKTIIYQSPVTVTILGGFKTGMSLFFGWTAIYARKQNLYNGFLDRAVNRWQKTVDEVVRDVIKRL